MTVFAANLSLMFTEWDFLDRFAVAADQGFEAVEFQFAYDHKPEAIRRRLDASRLTLALINAPPGDYDAGERGLAALSGRAEDFRASIAEAQIYAEHLNARAVHVMAGIGRGSHPASREVFRDSLIYAVERLDPIPVMIEPLNGRDAPGYFLNDFALAEGVIAEIGRPGLKLQFDIYHRQILHGDVLTALGRLMPLIGHIQIASVPTRTEPGTGELNDEMILSKLDTMNYAGFVGCEYRPARGTVAGLGWLSAWRRPRENGLALKSTWRDRL